MSELTKRLSEREHVLGETTNYQKTANRDVLTPASYRLWTRCALGVSVEAVLLFALSMHLYALGTDR